MYKTRPLELHSVSTQDFSKTKMVKEVVWKV
jgi:hypothetical protein